MAVVEPIIKYKVVFLGDESVGKTSVITSFMHNKFDTTYKPTNGIDFWSKTMYLDHIRIRLQLWDAAGQERFRSQIPSYIKDSSAVVIVYDVTNQNSFLNTSTWIEEVHKVGGTDVIIVLVANKCHLVDKRQVTIEEGDDKARELGFMFTETSAKQGLNIKFLFRKLATVLSKTESYLPTKQEDKVHVNNRQMMGLEIKDILELTRDEHKLKYGVKEETVYRVTKDKRGSSILETLMKDMLKKMEEMEEKVKECRNVYDERYENMLKRMEEIHNSNKRVEDNVKECGKVYGERCEDMLKRMEDMLRWMEEVKFNKIDVVEEHGTLQDMSKRLAEMQEFLIRRLGELQSQK